VLNISSKESDGILYVKGIKESKKLKELFKKSETKYIKLTCEYNKSFNKWQPIF
jgi:hypothetical protein